ncbi:2194_t:CDS:2 [Dentiscutata erythropus]|uniref:2194_t:CDS:1 n=1 Tax=Dentiscutata erythropus TaxID=1348616 RepID=A0A9N9JZ56_9GLOM|nr:2194_t:CDS:2 [Dentiscutata erythropus]
MIHEVAKWTSAYNTIKNFTRKINNKEKNLNEFQPLSKKIKNDKPYLSEERELLNFRSPSHFILISFDSELYEYDSSDEKEGFCLDINTASFDDYLD